MAYNLCIKCFAKERARLGHDLEVYATRAFPWSTCAQCGGQAFHLLPYQPSPAKEEPRG